MDHRHVCRGRLQRPQESCGEVMTPGVILFLMPTGNYTRCLCAAVLPFLMSSGVLAQSPAFAQGFGAAGPAFAQGSGAAGRGAQASPPTARASAPIDLTGYWVAIVSEDWRWRMLTPAKGDFP